jgi:pyochelin biosynthetic protein PchC
LWQLRAGTTPQTGTLLLLAHAGGSFTSLQELTAHVDPGLRVVAAQYPGRGARSEDPLVRQLTGLVQPLAAAVAQAVGGRLVIFGHSMGAMVGWRLIQLLETWGRTVEGFVASGCAPPHLAEEVMARRPTGADSDLLAYLDRLGGLPPEILTEPELLEIVLDVTRADFRVTKDFPTQTLEPLLSCPVMALGGRDDDTVPAQLLPDWSKTTRSTADCRIFSGGHFYFRDHLAEVGAAIDAVCAAQRR